MYYQTENGTREETPPIKKKRGWVWGWHWVRTRGGKEGGSREEEGERRKKRVSQGNVIEEYGKLRQTEEGEEGQTEWQGSIK